MQLADYMKLNNVSNYDLMSSLKERKINVSIHAIRSWKTGKRRPRINVQVALENITTNNVTLRDWI